MNLFLEYGNDFVLDQNGDLSVATGWDSVRQDIERAFLTSPSTDLPGQGPLPPDYLFHPTYGTGAQRDIGEHVTQDQLATIIAKLQLAAAGNPDVDPQSPIQVSVATAFQQITLTAVVTLKNKTIGTTVFTVG